jgi:hypothetical protein
MCHHSEKLIQLTRIILHETRQHQLTRFILYFATGVSVDYFYKVRGLDDPACRPLMQRCRFSRCFYQKLLSFSHFTAISLLLRGREH